jgi:hypothetical protein
MSPFTEILQDLNEKLDLPQPEKSKIILEVSSDLNDAMAYHISRGSSREDAIRRASETFSVSDETIAQLVRIHESLFRRVMEKLSSRILNRCEKVALISLLLFISVVTGTALMRLEFLVDASRFVWPVAGVAFSVLVVALWKFYRLYIKKVHTVKTLRNGLPLIFFLGAGSLFMGFYGFFLETYCALNRLLGGAWAPDLWMDYLLGVSSLLIVSLLVTILAGLVWIVFSNKVYRIEQAEAVMLLCE